jgi:hypothetical protein
MRVPKKTIASKIAFYYAKSAVWKPGFSFLALPLRVLAKKKYTTRIEMFFGVPVHFIQSKVDFKVVASWLDQSADLLKPFWTDQIKNAFRTIIIEDSGPMIKYDQRDKCWMINPIRLGKLRGAKLIATLIMNLIGALCVEILFGGRFCYFGVKNAKSITYHASARVLRKCGLNEDCYNDILWCYQIVDSVRPGRAYAERFKWGKS